MGGGGKLTSLTGNNDECAFGSIDLLEGLMKQMIAVIKTTSLLMVFLLLFLSRTRTVSSAFLAQDPPTSTPTSTSSPTLTFTPTYTATPTFTPTPLTGLTLASTTYGCTSGPYITCSASVVTTHTDPYRWDFDITYTYGDNRTNMGSNFTYKIKFNTGVYYSGVPIWWNMYPITNEVMPNRKIDIYYSGVSDLASMDYPSGTWTVPGQPYPYNDFTVVFSRTTTAPEILVRTDKWHLTLATYPNVATPTNTPTPTFTPTKTFTPTSMPTSITYTPVPGTPQNNGSGACWISGASWLVYNDIEYSIDSATIPESWIPSIQNAALTWTNITPSQFTLSQDQESPRFIDLGPIDKSALYIALTSVYASPNVITNVTTTFDEDDNFDVPPASNSYHVQNVMTHEFGHWLKLDDIYETGCGDVTMWHGISYGETKKVTLELADITGANWQYP